MAEFAFPGFNRRYVLVPMLAAIALVMVAYFIGKQRRAEVTNVSAEIRQSQERMRLLAEVVYTAADAESAQRGYLLTLDQKYLKPYDRAKQRLKTLLPEMLQYYSNDSVEWPNIQRAKAFIDSKFTEIQATIELVKTTGGTTRSLEMVNTDVGLHWMEKLREEIEDIRAREHERIFAGIESWQRLNMINNYFSGGVTALIIVLLLVTGTLVTRDIERRNAAARRLDLLVEERTAELSALSEHLQRATELEKSRLARELHDELGGLLVAIKMDLSQLARVLDVTPPDIQVRWQRIQSALSAGVELKRRVIEELRPTLLDNMGLVAALRWQAEETCANANITLHAKFPDEELKLDTNVAIALFRVAQETLTNMVKHARATQVTISLELSPVELVMTIQDNGVGIGAPTTRRIGAHGLMSMKHRMQSIGGSFYIGAASPQGTIVIVRLPMEIANATASLN